jgi:hypothetical protein
MTLPTYQVFDEAAVLHHLKHYLPTQAPLKDFIHHNTLHAFQDLKFHEAMRLASLNFGYRTYEEPKFYQDALQTGRIRENVLDEVIRKRFPSDNAIEIKEALMSMTNMDWKGTVGSYRIKWMDHFGVNMNKEVHPLLFRIVGLYLDQGISSWSVEVKPQGLLNWLRSVEENSFFSFFRTKKIRNLFLDGRCSAVGLLSLLVADQRDFERYLFDQQFEHPGWSGMVAVVEDTGGGLIQKRDISLSDFIILELLLELDVLEQRGIRDTLPSSGTTQAFPDFGLKRADFNLLATWHEAYEWSYYQDIIKSLASNDSKSSSESKPSFQSIFCIDDRECSLRRLIESLDSRALTYGTAGFFSLDFYFQSEHSLHATKVCPAPVTPLVIVRERESRNQHKKVATFNKHSHGAIAGWFISQSVGLWSGFKLAKNIFFPAPSAKMVSSFHHIDPQGRLEYLRTADYKGASLQKGFSIEELATKLGGMLRSIGMTSSFADIVYIIGHGASSVNNTHYAGYDCGACSGRPGSANARVAANALNRKDVRAALMIQGIEIPSNTTFVAALHDTTRDEIMYYDLDLLSQSNRVQHESHDRIIQDALEKNASERARKFELVNSKLATKQLHQSVKKRSVSLFEPRPEWNHATNAFCIVGRRELSRGVNLDRRSFLQSYDYSLDTDGNTLLGILRAVSPVCGGINLEYYFSRLDQNKLGAGSKLPHNVVGLIGVSNGVDGDLRTGLPAQMLNIHEPVRLMVIIEQETEFIKNVLARDSNVKQWYDQEWIHLVAIHPTSRKCYRYANTDFQLYSSN